MNRMPPGMIILLLQIQCFPYQDQLTADNGSRAVDEWYDQLLYDNLIDVVDTQDSKLLSEDRIQHGLIVTSRGKALIDKWCETLLPVLEEKWV